MPGRIMTEMESQTSPIPGLLKRDGSHLSQPSDGPDHKRVAFGDNLSSTKLNGANHTHVTNGIHNDAGMVKQESQEQDPPEIEQYRDSLVPFGRMLERMAQQTYFDLTELVEAMADMHVQPQPAAVNGANGLAAADNSAVSVDKKMRLLNFAQLHKDRYIKGLVLSDWARNMDDMAKLIDVSMCLRKVDWATNAAPDSIYRLKENMVGAKMPNPNIEGALELLSTGQAPWMPDLGYIPPKPLSAPELLDTLADMNFALTVRLNLHEQLPQQLSNFTIANGRVTFIVKDEFEVDLAIADEEPDSPFYFIDLRLTFTPTVSLNQDRLRNSLEAQANAVLASSGLIGCYNFLHNFVLTHKLNMLRCQALELARGKWIENIEVQSVHRTIIIHYWTHLPNGKNWIELGIASGDTSRAGDDTVPGVRPSVLSCRWFRRGKEVKDHDLRFDFADLAVEKMLEQVVATHASGRLTVLHDALVGLSRDSTTFAQQLKTSSSSTEDCSLRLLLDPLSTALTVSVDAIRGGLVASPGSEFAAELELELNEENKDPALTLRKALCREVLQRATEQGQSVGLARVAVLAPQGNASPFPAHVVAQRSFRLQTAAEEDASSSMAPPFVLTAACSLVSGLVWYTSETANKDGALTIKSASPLESQSALHRAALLAVTTVASRKIAVLTLSRELSSKQIRFFASENAGARQDESGSIVVATTSLLPQTEKTANILADAAILSLGDAKGLSFIFSGFLKRTTRASTVRHLCDGLKGEQDINMGLDRSMTISLQPNGEQPVVTLLQSRLQSIVQLYGMIEAVHKFKATLVSASPSEISFKYAENLSCTIRQPPDSPLLAFSTADSSESPHSRLTGQLEAMLFRNGFDVSSFHSLLGILAGTLPLLKVLPKPSGDLAVLCQAPLSYKISYKSPYQVLALRITASPRPKRLVWLARLAAVRSMSPRLRLELQELFNKGKGHGWIGCKNHALATAEGIKEYLEKFGQIMEQNREEREVVEID